MLKLYAKYFALSTIPFVVACATSPEKEIIQGTTEPFASEAIYFLMTDRFVDGDSSNNHTSQGGDNPTFDRPIQHDDGTEANIGYLGGDFKGILDNAEYIRDLGFSAIWLSPIVSNPDEAFTGGSKLGESIFADHNKTGYHGYWGVNFYELDEHWPSPNLNFEQLTGSLYQQYGIKTVLDIVANHGSPSFSMPEDQPMFGELYDADGTLVADHQNIEPENLSGENALHDFFHREKDIAELSNIDEENAEAVDYFINAYLKWLGQGAHALRIDTIRHMPHSFWKDFSDRVRSEHPNLFMFGESFDFRAEKIAEHTQPENGRISVLDFPGREAMQDVFEKNKPMSRLLDYLHLHSNVYDNPYDLVTFYDNHDMSRLDATDNNFINVNNWLFTSRGIPAVYYGSEIGFMRGRKEHYGNRNYFGQNNIEIAKNHPIAKNLSEIALHRKASIALQRGAQINIDFGDSHAVFLRVYQDVEQSETVMVLLNKSSQPLTFKLPESLPFKQWRDVTTHGNVESQASVIIPANGYRLLQSLQPVSKAIYQLDISLRDH